MKEAADDGDFLAEIIFHFAEHAAAEEIKVSDLESRLSQLEMGGQPMLTPHQ